MTGYRVLDVKVPKFLASAQCGGEWSASGADRFTLEESLWQLLNWQVGDPRSRSGCFEEERSFHHFRKKNHNSLVFLPRT